MTDRWCHENAVQYDYSQEKEKCYDLLRGRFLCICIHLSVEIHIILNILGSFVNPKRFFFVHTRMKVYKVS